MQKCLEYLNKVVIFVVLIITRILILKTIDYENN